MKCPEFNFPMVNQSPKSANSMNEGRESAMKGRMGRGDKKSEKAFCRPVQFLDFVDVFGGGDGTQVTRIHHVNAHRYMEQT